MRRYLAGFGPAGLRDVASFAGVPVTLLKPVVKEMDLRTFRDEAGGELLDVPDGDAAGPGHSRARPVPADLGRDAARPRAANAGPSGALSAR